MKAANIIVGKIYAIRRKGPRNTLRHVSRAIVVGKEDGDSPKIFYVVLRANEDVAPPGSEPVPPMTYAWVRRRAVVALWVTVAPEIVEQWQNMPHASVADLAAAQIDATRRAEIATALTRRAMLDKLSTLSNADLVRALAAL